MRTFLIQMSNSPSQVDFVATHLSETSNVLFKKESFIIPMEVCYLSTIFITQVSMRYTSMVPTELEDDELSNVPSSHEFLEASKACCHMD